MGEVFYSFSITGKLERRACLPAGRYNSGVDKVGVKFEIVKELV